MAPHIATARKASPIIAARFAKYTTSGLRPRLKSTRWYAVGAMRKADASAVQRRTVR